ncbi:MAG: pathosis-related transcriptional factor and protein [Akkermansiaceae bacterium]|nr:pathosis-related transcriptional factor and protein [Akkermansiaceae bacterium]
MWTPEDTYAIARIDLPSASTHGWQVRLQRRGVKYGKYFADRSCGGQQESYELARRWRDDLMSRVEEEENAARICSRSARNSSGVVGVSKVAVSAPNGATYFFWQATWCPAPGERRCVKFSVKRHGEKQAFKLAVEARREGTGI